jgi:hypothetical protein
MTDRREATVRGRVDAVPRPPRGSRLTVIDDPPLTGEARSADHGRHRDATVAQDGGVLLAVCGLCGGAGTSTLTYLIAAAIARSTPRPVLVTDASSPGGTIASLAGVQSPRSLTELTAQVAAGLPTGPLVATTSNGLRVLATSPRLTATCDSEVLRLLLDQARERYVLTVIDCGTLATDAAQVALGRASHVAWLLPRDQQRDRPRPARPGRHRLRPARPRAPPHPARRTSAKGTPDPAQTPRPDARGDADPRPPSP